MEHRAGTAESWQEAVLHWGFTEAGRVSLEGGVRITATVAEQVKQCLKEELGPEELEERILAEVAYAALHDAVRASTAGADNWDLLTRIPSAWGTLLYMTVCPQAPGHGEERWVLRGIRHLPMADGSDPAIPKMPVNAQKMLYTFLRECFPAGERLLTSAVGATLKKFEFDFKALGYAKLGQMLGAMDRCAVQLPGGLGVGAGIYLMPDPCWDEDAPALPTAAEIEALLAKDAPPAPKAPSPAPGWEGMEQYGLAQVEPALLEPLPADGAQVYVTLNAQKSLLNGISGGTADEMARLSAEQWRTLRENYALGRRLCFARRNIHQENSYYFPTGFSTPAGEPLFQAVSPNNREAGKGICLFIGTLRKQRTAEPAGTVPAPRPEPAPVPDVPLALPESLSEAEVFIPQAVYNAMYCLLNDAYVDLRNKTLRLCPTPEEMQMLRDSYTRAHAAGQVCPVKDGYLFQVDQWKTPHGRPLQALIVPNQRADGAPWVLKRVSPAPPRQALERWAYIGSWEELLNRLADMALKENWDFADNNRKPVLKSYLCYTFYRLQLEGKVTEGDRLAVFNTGLVNDTYDDIYAVFVPNAANPRWRWRFQDLCVKGEGLWGKKIVSCFSSLPQPARYFKAEDLLYDCSKLPEMDKNHIVLERLHRWPVDVLRSELESPEAVRLLDRLEAAAPAERDDRFEDLRSYLETNQRARNRLVDRLNSAVERAVKRVRWNYQTALPAYFPTHNSMSLMLPLDLNGSGRDDVALVVERQPSGAYLGATILTLDMAYVDARLVCRPDKDWLNNESIRDVAGEEEADD